MKPQKQPKPAETDIPRCTLVRLKCGGHTMVVSSLSEQEGIWYCNCVWHADGVPQEESYPEDILEHTNDLNVE